MFNQWTHRDYGRQGPRFSIRMIIWIFCSDNSDTLVVMSISPVSTVIFPKSETAMVSTQKKNVKAEPH